MKYSHGKSGVITGLALTVGLLVATSASAADCPDIPKVPWWGNINHETISVYVNKKHNGDWAPYVKKWQRQLEFMQDVEARGGRAIIKSKGITLEDERLAQYVVEIGQRVEAINCLAAIMSVSNFETAAGQEKSSPSDK